MLKAPSYRKRTGYDQANGLTQRASASAVGTLLKVMHDTSATWSGRVAAATQVLQFARESIELDDLAARVEALERDADSGPRGRMRRYGLVRNP